MIMNIESIIKQIAEEKFSGYSYLFENWYDADTKLERMNYPAIVCIVPSSGATEIKNGRIYDKENIALCFLDKAPRNAEGEDNAEIYTRMKADGAKFIHALNKTRAFLPLDGELYYDMICERLSSVVTGVMYSLTIKQAIGECMNG